MSLSQFLQRLPATSFLAVAVAVTGCATVETPADSPEIHAVIPTSHEQVADFIPVARYGRYTLVELTPTAQQRDLLLQTVDVALPDDTRATVGDGLRHVLKRSGYQLCASAPATAELHALPLPAAHLHLGPLTLHDALLTLAGPSWVLKVDEPLRQVCFVRADSVDETPSAPDREKPETDEPQTGAAQTFPVPAGVQP
jgi:type IV pili sensor histidine kinase/response regulator